MINNKIGALVLTSMLVLNATLANAAGKDGVAAVVNGKNIMVAEIKEAYDLAPGVKDKVTFEEFYDKTLNEFVANEIIYQEAVTNKVKESPEYKAQLKAMEKALAGKVFLEQQVDKLINDEQLKKVYEDYKSKFKPEKEVKAKHILVDSEAKAKEVIAKLDKGGNFDKLAKEYSKDGADLGYFTKEVMVPEFSEAAFSMEKGTYSKTPTKTKFGYHVILVEDIRDTEVPPFEKAKGQIKAAVAQSAAGAVLNDISTRAKVVRYDTKGNEITEK